MIIALSGGVGGAKLALGLSRILKPEELLVVVNTGDDFEHLGLSISPDIDTVAYTLAGLANREVGWGRHDETWSFMETMEALGGETWFRLGDRDVALHVERTRRLRLGESLSAVTDALCRRMGIAQRILPMSDDPVRTRLLTEQGWLDFQDYFVRLRCTPEVREIAFAGASDARPQPEVLAALAADNLSMVIICPSNPLISIDPILSVPGMRGALRSCRAPVIAVSPIIGGKAVKGPTAKLMAELGLSVDPAAVARHYADIIDHYIIDEADAGAVSGVGAPITATRTLMETMSDRDALARVVLAVGQSF